MGDVLHIRFRKPKKRRKAPGLALSFGATSDGRIVFAASGRRYYTTAELTELIADLRGVRDDAISRRKANEKEGSKDV
jgi:hypothetical protein